MGSTIGRTLRLALLGLTLALAVVATLAVADVYRARQDYEDRLARAYQLEAAASRLLAAGVVEEAALRARGANARAARLEAAEAFDVEADRAERLALGDVTSERLLALRVQAERAARSVAAEDGTVPGRLDRAVLAARRASTLLARRQAQRREQARDDVGDETRSAIVVAGIAGGLLVLGALLLVAGLIGTMRRPLDRLVRATRRIAAGRLDARVEPEGPRELRDLGEAFNAMADDLDAAHARLLQERHKLAVTIESLGDALVVCDAEGIVTDLNPRAAELVPEIAVGEPAAASHVLPALGDALASEVVLERGDRTLAVTAAELGGGAGTVWTLRDVSERARLDRLRREFIATASHELRSPLTSVKGFVELLSESELDETASGWVEKIQRGTNRLVDLVEDLLEVAALEAGRISLRREPTDVATAVREAVADLLPRIEEKGQTAVVDVAPDLPPLLADPRRVRQILVNLVTNAHLYTPAGGSVTVSAREEAGHVAIAVADTGQGIRRDDLPHVFERFYRGEMSNTSVRGSGLGLSIVRSLVEAQRGSIDVESEVGSGTTFTVRLPVVPAVVERLRASTDLDGRRVVVVDDEPDLVDVVRAQLEALGAQVEIAGDGETAIDLLRRRGADAVVLDLGLPDGNGLDVLAEIRSDPDLAATRVVLLSARAGDAGSATAPLVSRPLPPDDVAEALGAVAVPGRSALLVAGRPSLRGDLEPILDRFGARCTWVEDAEGAREACLHERIELALVDAGMDRPDLVVAGLQLRGRRLPRAVLLVSSGDDAPEAAGIGERTLALHEVNELLRDHAGR